MCALVYVHAPGVCDYTFESLSQNAKKTIPNGMVFLARDKGFEPLTFWSVARRSIQLS